MERNSRDFQERIRRENRNAEMLCTILRERRSTGPLAEGMTPTLSTSSSTCVSTPSRPLVIKEVYYPKYMTPTHYLTYLRPSPSDSFLTGFGGLFSLTFTSQLASEVFFDNLPCYKGPSLGTNFTLACPYTVLAHYTEFDWAKEWGVEQGLVRISTGLEDEELLKEWFEKALSAAEEAVGRVQGGV
jgi:cystathionine gamma-synthase